jgi:hypothetical protein
MTGMDQVQRLIEMGRRRGAEPGVGPDPRHDPGGYHDTPARPAAEYTPRHLTPGDGYWHPTPMEDGRRVAAYHAQNGAQRLTPRQARRRHKNNRAGRHA